MTNMDKKFFKNAIIFHRQRSLHMTVWNLHGSTILLIWVILLTVCHTLLMMLVQRIWYWIKKKSISDIFILITSLFDIV